MPADQESTLQAAVAETDRLARLVESLLVLARADAGVATPVPVDVAEISLGDDRAPDLASRRGIGLQRILAAIRDVANRQTPRTGAGPTAGIPDQVSGIDIQQVEHVSGPRRAGSTARQHALDCRKVAGTNDGCGDRPIGIVWRLHHPLPAVLHDRYRSLAQH